MAGWDPADDDKWIVKGQMVEVFDARCFEHKTVFSQEHVYIEHMKKPHVLTSLFDIAKKLDRIIELLEKR